MPAFFRGSVVLSFLAVGTFLSSLVTSLAYATPFMMPPPPEINAKGYVLMDFDSGRIIAAGHEDIRMAPASLTKIMTAYVAGQEIKGGRLSLDDVVTVSRNAWSRNFPDSSKMFIEPKDEISVKNILHGIMVQSGNDASVALAEHVAGSEEGFVAMMNSWAERLGLQDTRFINAHGLDGQDISTSPTDMALLARAMIRDVPEVYKIYGTKSFTWNNIRQFNRNELLWDKSLDVDGMKTGYTSGAGYNLVTSATQDGMRLISVVMGAPSSEIRKVETRKLLTYGFRFYETDTLLDEIEPAVSEKVWLGKLSTINLGIDEDAILTLPRGQLQNVTVEYQVNGPLKAPVAQGDVLGAVRWKLGDEVLLERNLLALDTVESGGLFKRLADSITLFFSSLMGAIAT